MSPVTTPSARSLHSFTKMRPVFTLYQSFACFYNIYWDLYSLIYLFGTNKVLFESSIPAGFSVSFPGCAGVIRSAGDCLLPPLIVVRIKNAT